MRRVFAVVPFLLAGCMTVYEMHVDVTHRVRCSVTRADGSPAAGVTVEVNDGRESKTAVTDAQGEASIEHSYGGCHGRWVFARCRMFYPSKLEVRAENASRRIEIADRYASADHDVELRLNP